MKEIFELILEARKELAKQRRVREYPRRQNKLSGQIPVKRAQCPTEAVAAVRSSSEHFTQQSGSMDFGDLLEQGQSQVSALKGNLAADMFVE